MLALGTRLYGIGWGGPFVYHPDERLEVGHALRMVATRDLHPHFFLKPTLFLYIQAAVFSVVQYVADTPVSEEMYSRGSVSPDPPASAFLYHWWGRCIAAVVGGLSVLLAYAIGRRLYHPGVGLWAAFFLSITPRHALESHYAAVDVPVTCVCLLALLFTVRAFQAGERKDWALAGLLAGFAASTKYPGGLIVLACVVALLLSPPPPAPGFLTEHSCSAVPVLGLHLSLALCWGPLTPCLIFLSSFGMGLPTNGTITAPATLDRKARQITGGICAIPSSTSSDLP